MRIIILLIILFPVILFSRNEHQTGIYLSSGGGLGICYKYDTKEDFHIQLTAFPYYTGTDIPDKMKAYPNIGLKLEYDLYSIRNKRIYLFGSYNKWWAIRNNYTIETINDVPIRTNFRSNNHIDNYFFGTGYEYIFQRVTFSFDIGYHYQSTTGIGDPNWIDLSRNSNSISTLGAGIAIRYILR